MPSIARKLPVELTLDLTLNGRRVVVTSWFGVSARQHAKITGSGGNQKVGISCIRAEGAQTESEEPRAQPATARPAARRPEKHPRRARRQRYRRRQEGLEGH